MGPAAPGSAKNRTRQQMLIEEKNVRQIPGEGFRRWFFDDYFDLIIWYDNDHALKGFQLCYDKFRHEKVLTWIKSKGYSHDEIDEGEVPGEHKKSPILVADGPFNRESVGKKFLEASSDMEPDLRDLVYRKICEHNI